MREFRHAGAESLASFFLIARRSSFASKFMGAKAADDDHIPMIQPETGGAFGHNHPRLGGSGPVRPLLLLPPAASDSPHSALHPDIAVICMKPDHGKRIAHQLQALGIPHLLMATRSGKRAYDPRKFQVNILSVQSSKGLEFQSVILIGLLP